MLQSRVSLLGPSQGRPSGSGTGSSHSRLRDWTLPSQLLVEQDQAFHGLKPPFTATDQTCFFYQNDKNWTYIIVFKESTKEYIVRHLTALVFSEAQYNICFAMYVYWCRLSPMDYNYLKTKENLSEPSSACLESEWLKLVHSLCLHFLTKLDLCGIYNNCLLLYDD